MGGGNLEEYTMTKGSTALPPPPSLSKKGIPSSISGNLAINLGEIPIEHGKRYLLTVNPDGTPNVSEIPHDTSIARMDHYLEMLNKPNGMWVDTDTLQRFVDAATARLAARIKKIIKAGEITTSRLTADAK